MNGFRYRTDWTTGGGECVSLSTLYAAALFVVGGIVLSRIFLLATPLHSQNYIDVATGILTNNRRIVTKNMLFNGSELSTKARRSLENERITIVANCGPYIHTLYETMSINENRYKDFSDKLRSFLRTEFSPEIFGNFLRSHPQYHSCFCYRFHQNNREWYITAEKALRYEADSQLRVSDRSRKKLFASIDLDEFYPEHIPGTLIVNDLEHFIRSNNLDMDNEADREALRERFCNDCLETCDIIQSLKQFIHIEPKLPDIDAKKTAEAAEFSFDPESSRAEITEKISDMRENSLTADLAFHAFREPGNTLDAYFHAALRNPVCIEESASMETEALIAHIHTLSYQSVYSGNRLAMPDEVWNFQRGDGLEKAVMLTVILYSREVKPELKKTGNQLEIQTEKKCIRFETEKKVPDFSWIPGE